MEKSRVALTKITEDIGGRTIKGESLIVNSFIAMANKSHLDFTFDFIGPWVSLTLDMNTGNLVCPTDGSFMVYDFEMLKLESEVGTFTALLAWVEDEDNVTMYKLVGRVRYTHFPEEIAFFEVPPLKRQE